MKEEFDKKGIIIDSSNDFIEELWSDRPSIPSGKVFSHDVRFAGKTAEEKLNLIRERMKEEGANYYIISSLDDIAWLLNLRGNDVKCNPVFLSYLLLEKESCTLYIDKEKLDNKVITYLNENGVEIKEYEDIINDLKKLRGSIVFDPSKTNVWLASSIPSGVNIKEEKAITTLLKAKKNKVELKNIENAHVKDGVAMVKFLKWLDENVGKEEITEISASDKLEAFRAEGDEFVEISFDTIAGYGEHGAIIHYKATEDTNVKLQPKGLFLVDSGAQYLDGTTDITRTIALGDLTQEEKDDYTLVLKGHLNLGNALFLEGTQGCRLDILARRALWNRGLDFKHGTGHGVGYFLSVHEGPQQIRKDLSSVELEEGMVISNEPGIYRGGSHGVRIENLIAVEYRAENEFGKFMGFKEFTLCPYELRAINKELLNSEEIQWINDYHKKVFNTLSPYLNEDETAWLKNATKSI